MIDLLLLLMAVIWGSNYSIVKSVFDEVDPQAFNALRMTMASLIFLVAVGGARVRARYASGATSDRALASVFYTPAVMTRRDWGGLVLLGIVGHCSYQYFFMAGLARTSVANSSLMLGATPALVALISAGLGLERIGRRHWLGVGLSLAGIYLVVGQGFSLGAHGATGDLLMLLAVLCWAIYTIGARPLMIRHSPLGVTAFSMLLGTLLYVPLVAESVASVQWSAVSVRTWGWMLYSAAFSLCLCYTIWYAGIRQLGSARTSIYSNLVPIFAMATAVLALHEPVGMRKVAGAAAVLGGVALTRLKA